MKKWTITACALVLLSAVTAGAQDKDIKKQESYTLGVLFFDGFELLDAMGPLEMLGNVGPQLKIITVAEKPGVITSSQKIKTVADYGFDDCPKVDILLVPGGFGGLQFIAKPENLKWLKKKGEEAQLVTSVCNGSQLLAQAGLLDARKATTNKAYYKMITSQNQTVDWQAKARWVDDGDRITSSGVSAGIDMSLYLIARLFGEERATWDPFSDIHLKNEDSD